MNSQRILKIAKKVLKVESQAINQLINKLSVDFEKSIQAILKCKGRIIILGIGKSGIIGKKIAATMSSTGTPSYFVHPAEAIHGDLGMITNNDIIILISNSGETSELIQLINPLKLKKVKIIGMIGNKDSTLANQSDFNLDTSIDEEACPLDLAPTASTSATLALGDALAIVLLELKGFDKEDFAKLHPGGSLGKKLILQVNEISHKGNRIPFILENSTIKEALLTISDMGFGVTGVLNKKDEMIGIITDGDIRRELSKRGNKLFEHNVVDIMSKNPKSIKEEILAIEALEIMEKHSITSLFTYGESSKGKPSGIIHIHDILKLGIK